MLEYSKEQLWSLYKQLPQDLQQATFSEKIAQNIQEICNKNGIGNTDLVTKITKGVGYVFLGLLSPKKLSQFFETNLKITKEQASKITADLTEAILIPLKKNLSVMYDIKITIPKVVKKKDNYREKIN